MRIRAATFAVAVCGTFAFASAGASLTQPSGIDRALYARLMIELECKAGQKCDPVTTMPLTRGVRGKGAGHAPANVGTDAGRQAVQEDARHGSYPTSETEVYYEFNSVELSARTRQILDTIAAVIKHERNEASKFALVGHTDAKGGDAFNMALSERRAAAAREYLETAHGIAGDRLSAWGRGRRELKNRAQPFSAVNRRVQVINLGPAASVGSPPPRPTRVEAPRPPRPQAQTPPAKSGTDEGCRFSPSANATFGCRNLR